MNLTKKIACLIFIITLVGLPSFAKINGGIFKSHFYDTEQTIMIETPFNKTLVTEEYWDKNLLYFNKYQPIFMLSNKEISDFMPRKSVSIVKRVITPAIYNISLKNSEIKTVSLSSPSTKNLIINENTVTKSDSSNNNLATQYEQAKNPNTDIEDKIKIAISLKDSKNFSNCSMALDLLDDVIKKEPYNAYAFYLKGEIYSEQNSPQSAMINYLAALKLNPTSKKCYLGIAKVLDPINKSLAQKYYDKAK